jgi:hypothetical protein
MKVSDGALPVFYGYAATSKENAHKSEAVVRAGRRGFAPVRGGNASGVVGWPRRERAARDG